MLTTRIFFTGVLVGLKGRALGWDWDSAVPYGKAHVPDASNGADSNALARQLALSTPDAYNPFNGSRLNGAGGPDCNPTSQSALAATSLPLKPPHVNQTAVMTEKQIGSPMLVTCQKLDQI